MDVYSGAANSISGRATKAAIRIQGGSFLARTLNVGSGWGADSLLSIESSRASAICVLDYCYLQAFADTNGKPGLGTLSFTLDEHGVTPIMIQSHRDGLRVIKDAASHCRLRILLSAIPPRDDITLVSGQVSTRGTFDDLPEGSEITAQYLGQTYRWKLTYHGGAGGNDLTLVNESTYAADAPVTHTRPPPEIPKPLWSQAPHSIRSPRKFTASPHFLAPKASARSLPAAVAARQFTWTTSTTRVREVCARQSRPPARERLSSASAA